MASIINTGLSALNAFKRQLETTGHNISNVNTEGYSRQNVELGTRPPEATSQGYIGSGVDINAITRSYDTYLATRVRNYAASYEEFSVFEQRSMQIDDVVADMAAGLDAKLQDFFNAVQDVADDPTSIPARTVMLNQATQLTERFHTLDRWLEDMRTQVNRDFESQVDEINSLSESLADVNARIRALGRATGNAPNDVLDERDKLIDDLSRYTDVSTVEQSDGTYNVFIGTGQALVVGAEYNRLGIVNNAQTADEKEIVIQQAAGSVIITDQMTGGSLGGLVRFRDEVLDPAQNQIGLVGIGLSSFFNGEHQTGLDLDGDLGGDFFSVASPQVFGDPTNAGTITASLSDVSQLTGHEYRLDFDGTNWSMTDLDTGSAVTLSGTGTVANPLVGDGVSIVIGTAAAAGDSYTLRPTRAGAASMNVLISNERDIAAADVVRTADGAANTGTGSIGAGALTTRSGSTKLATPITLSYQAGNQLAITAGPAGTQFVDANGNALGATATFTAGQTYRVDIPGLGIFDVQMTGSPAVGDTFSLADNTGGVGDNRNARRLANLQTANLMSNGTASITDTYSSMVADVGTKTQQAKTNASVQERLLSQAEEAKSEVSGVNLDEEAADLVRFQQAYQAAAQVINVANTLFDTLLGAVRR